MGRRWKNLTTGCFSNREQGWSSGESARFPPSHVQFRPGVVCGLSLLLVLVLSPRGFCPGSPVFLAHSKFQIDQDRGPTWKPAKAEVATSLNIVTKQKQILSLTFNHPRYQGNNTHLSYRCHSWVSNSWWLLQPTINILFFLPLAVDYFPHVRYLPLFSINVNICKV